MNGGREGEGRRRDEWMQRRYIEGGRDEQQCQLVKYITLGACVS